MGCLLACLAPCRGLYAIDESPLDVQVVPAFPELRWPDWVTGADEGRLRSARPVLVTGAGDGTNRIFVLSQYGSIHVFPNDPNVGEMSTFLDMRDRVQFSRRENEEGLLGFAPHPSFADNGEFFLYYTETATPESPHKSVIARYRVSADDPNVADPHSEEVLLEIEQPYWNHNGGTLVFGPDGYLYIVLGDGGAGGDPHGHGQNLKTLFGSILRIDVDRQDPGLPYAIPPDNPFVGRGGGVREEIWAYGLRNVWRMSFDRETDVCWAGDVGQDRYEEIDIIVKGGNYGWNLREGRHNFQGRGSGPRPDLIEPIWEYDHSVGKSITGGCVYRGKDVPELEGAYLYADYVHGQIWALWYDHDVKQVVANRKILESGGPITSFGEDDQGEVYFATEEGGLYRFRSPQSQAVTLDSHPPGDARNAR